MRHLRLKSRKHNLAKQFAQHDQQMIKVAIFNNWSAGNHADCRKAADAVADALAG